ncbi:MAG: methyltransferase domain-containing protein [Cyanobacteria bacterium]|nr:methyltransferase domain-containing protein [Cyanobacteriota bacterium]MDW8201934.1 methyltransferase domain-containing protein [Cyanobacteriota bacterium SKYGB_h_bin112]
MQPVVYNHFRNHIFKKFPPPGKRILEIGALADPAQTLLTIFAGQSLDQELIGINLEIPPAEYIPASLGYKLLECNANDMSIFGDAEFDAVICSGVLNNDRYFWKSLSEMHRVLSCGGLLYVNIPVFTRGMQKLAFKRILYKLGASLRKFGLEDKLISLAENTWFSSVPTYHYSPTPADYYRFSEASVTQVIMDGYDVLHIEEFLYPPRMIAVGKKIN